MWISQSVNTGCKLYYDIKNHILLYPFFSSLSGYHNLLTQAVSYTMISKTISYCILFSLSYLDVTINTDCKLYYDIKNHILLYPLFSFLCGYHNLFTQRVSYTMISKTISYCILFSFSYLDVTINTDCKLYYDIKNHILLYPLSSFLCGCHNILTQPVSYTMISKTISYCILFSLSYVNITIC